MGMFDYLCCELPLPEGQNWLYQTKDTQEWCEMKEFTITAEGRLVKHDYDPEATPEDELPHKDAPPGSFLRLSGCLRPAKDSERDVDQNFDGDLRFYPDGSNPGRVEYRATFRAGAVVEICRLLEGHWQQVWPVPPGVR